MAKTNLLKVGDPPPFNIYNAGGKSRCIIVCDHASNAIPSALDQLGLEDAELQSHIAWDIGALNVARLIADRLDAVVVSSGFSRLVIDNNRYPHDPTSIIEISDGVKVPGNILLPPDDAEIRKLEVFEPYHRAIEDQILKKIAAGVEPILLSIHSMAKEMNGVQREWPISVQSYDDKRLSADILDNLRTICEFPVGDNEPYRLEPSDYTVFEHAVSRQALHVQTEFRQDCVASDHGAEQLAAHYCAAIVPILEHPDLVARAAAKITG